MKKSVVMFAVLASALLPFRASAAENSADVHITIKQKETVLDKDITVTDIDGDGRLTSKDAIVMAHDLYFPGGAARGYADEQFIWGLKGEYFYSNFAAGEDFDPLLHNPSDKRRDLKDGDRITWEAGMLYDEMYYIYSPELGKLLEDGNSIPQGTEVRVAVNHLIPSQPMDEPASHVELTCNGEHTGVFTDDYGWAVIRLDAAGDWTLSAQTDSLGIPCRLEYRFAVTPTDTAVQAQVKAALAVQETERADAPETIQNATQTAAETVAQTEKQTAAETVAQTEKQTAAETAAQTEKQTAAETVVQTEKQTVAKNNTVRTNGAQTGETLPDIIITLMGAGVAALMGTFFVIFRKLR